MSPRSARSDHLVLLTLALVAAGLGAHRAGLGWSSHGDSRPIVEWSLPAILEGRYVPSRSLGNPLYEVGLQSRQRLPGLKRSAAAGQDVFVLPSRIEPYGLVIAEARALGLPIVATVVGRIPEALEGGLAGLLVPPQNPEALAQAIICVIRDPAPNHELRLKSAQRLEELSVERMARETIEVYRHQLTF